VNDFFKESCFELIRIRAILIRELLKIDKHGLIGAA
jgi:hypothetical protein